MSIEGFDKSQTMLAGEFLTLGHLLKRGYQASVTFGNAKSVDILAYNPRTDWSFAVQVKALRRPNCFPIKKEGVSANHIYVFVILNEGSRPEQFHIVKGEHLLSDVNHSGVAHTQTTKLCPRSITVR